MTSQIIQQGEALIMDSRLMTKREKKELEDKFYRIFKLNEDEREWK